MTEVLLKQITEITNEIKNIHGDDYGEQYCNVAINLISKNHSNINDYQILIEAAYSLIDSDYKDKLIFNLQKKLKEQESRITHLEKDNKDLKEQNKTLKERVIKLEDNNDKLTKQVNKLMRNHYNLVLWQAYKNVEYYIIQKVTGFNKDKMETINTNLTEFINNPNNNSYINDINKFITKFNINNYNGCLGRLSRNRLQEAHPNPIELDDLEEACDDMKHVYIGIDELYNHYQEVYDYFIKMKL
jgi:chromosome segregation ATPase